MTEINDEIRKILASLKNKRAAIVINHILEHGQISTEELARIGYNHPPRAARDVREAGIPLVTIRVKSCDGRSIGAYKFDDFSKIRAGRLAGRVTFPKAFHTKLCELHRNRCTICQAEYEKRYLQIDHRVPYEIGGDETNATLVAEKFMLLCGSCNRAKSWSCEHCDNWNQYNDPAICASCYWASPEDYTHVAMFPQRRMEVVWTGEEIENYDWIASAAREEGKDPQEFLKYIVELARIGKLKY